MTQSKIKLFFLFFIYFIVGIVFLWMSWGRSSFFTEHFENFSQLKIGITFFGFLFLFSSYLLLFFEKLPYKIKTLWWFIAPLILLYFLIPPFLTRDAASYVIIAKNFLWFGQNPYLNPIGNPLNPWVGELGNIWWLSYPSPYGPVSLLLTLPAVLLKSVSLIGAIYFYKIIVIATYIFSIVFIGLFSKESKKEKTILLFILNPAVFIHILIEGHNEIFILPALLVSLYFLGKESVKKSFLSFLFSVYLKFNSIIFLPVFWFVKRKISWYRIILSLTIMTASFFIFLRVFQWNLTDFANNLFFVNSFCIYSCSPIISLYSIFFKNVFKFGPKILFLIAYSFVYYFFLARRGDYLKFIFWSFSAFIFLGVTWLTPWYLVLIIPIGLLIEGRLYQTMTLFLTFYSLFHSFGI